MIGRREFFLFGCAAMMTSPRVWAAENLMAIDVALGDVSINKVPFLVAADNGIYEKNGLAVHQYITPAAAAVRASGVEVPKEYIGAAVADAPVSVGGGDPMIARAARNPDAPLRIIVSTTETIFRSHLIAGPSVSSFTDLKGKRIGTQWRITRAAVDTFLKG
jgi:ABC-type nitrate/sulfonate/bicarbonate transport system substrate-binding protein